MRCKDCEFWKNNVCLKAQYNQFSELEGDCLLRINTVLLRDILEELMLQSDDKTEGEDWKL